jgi:hypothetical protein
MPCSLANAFCDRLSTESYPQREVITRAEFADFSESFCARYTGARTSSPHSKENFRASEFLACVWGMKWYLFPHR